MLLTEKDINQALSIFEEQGDQDTSLTHFVHTEPAAAAFLFSADTDILVPAEKNYYSFLVAFYWSLINQISSRPNLSTQAIDELAESNWSIILNRGSQAFRESLDSVFDAYQETEALAFLEDSLAMDENDFLSNAGRDYIFVMIKSMLDYYLDLS